MTGRSPSGRATHERSQSLLSPPSVGVPNAWYSCSNGGGTRHWYVVRGGGREVASDARGNYRSFSSKAAANCAANILNHGTEEVEAAISVEYSNEGRAKAAIEALVDLVTHCDDGGEYRFLIEQGLSIDGMFIPLIIEGGLVDRSAGIDEPNYLTLPDAYDTPEVRAALFAAHEAASAMSAGTAATTQIGAGLQPASATRQDDAQEGGSGND